MAGRKHTARRGRKHTARRTRHNRQKNRRYGGGVKCPKCGYPNVPFPEEFGEDGDLMCPKCGTWFN